MHIRAAAEWLFDSVAEPNETSALLFASIGLEAVLLSTEKETTARLADRIAYLLGKVQSDRKELFRKFGEFYKARSKLIHGKAQRISDSERELLRWGQKHLHMILKREIESVYERHAVNSDGSATDSNAS